MSLDPSVIIPDNTGIGTHQWNSRGWRLDSQMQAGDILLVFSPHPVLVLYRKAGVGLLVFFFKYQEYYSDIFGMTFWYNNIANI